MNGPSEGSGTGTGTGGYTDRPAVLRLDDVHAGYGPFLALFGVSFTIHAAEALALIGPNGAGKTTVARVASGLLPPTTGRIEVGGQDFSHRPAQDFATAGIAHAPEGRSVFGTLNVEENLTLPFRRQFGRSGVRAALDHAYDLFPNSASGAVRAPGPCRRRAADAHLGQGARPGAEAVDRR